MCEYKDQIFEALRNSKLKVVIERWLEFIEMCAMKADSKLRDLDELFG